MVGGLGADEVGAPGICVLLVMKNAYEPHMASELAPSYQGLGAASTPIPYPISQVAPTEGGVCGGKLWVQVDGSLKQRPGLHICLFGEAPIIPQPTPLEVISKPCEGSVAHRPYERSPHGW
jgi:hypothetical protein